MWVYRVEMTDQRSIRKCTYSIRVQITCHTGDRDALWQGAAAIRRVRNNGISTILVCVQEVVQPVQKKREPGCRMEVQKGII